MPGQNDKNDHSDWDIFLCVSLSLNLCIITNTDCTNKHISCFEIDTHGTQSVKNEKFKYFPILKNQLNNSSHFKDSQTDIKFIAKKYVYI